MRSVAPSSVRRYPSLPRKTLLETNGVLLVERCSGRRTNRSHWKELLIPGVDHRNTGCQWDNVGGIYAVVNPMSIGVVRTLEPDFEVSRKIEFMSPHVHPPVHYTGCHQVCFAIHPVLVESLCQCTATKEGVDSRWLLRSQIVAFS